VETRSGYFAVPDTAARPVTPEEMAGLRALDTQPRPHAFEFLSRAYRFRDAGGKAQYAIAFEMPISNLTATPAETAHKHRLHASLLALVKDASGQIVERVSKDVPSEVSDDQLAAVQVELMTYQHAVNLAPGHVIRLKRRWWITKATGPAPAWLQIDNREQTGVGLSDLTLVRRLETLSRQPDAADPFEYTGKRVLPFVTTDMFAGAALCVLRGLSRTGERREAGAARAVPEKRPVAWPRASFALPEPDASGAIPMVIEPIAKPGTYEVRATVAQGGSSTERSLAYTLAGK
jgi:hypothetical protein